MKKYNTLISILLIIINFVYPQQKESTQSRLREKTDKHIVVGAARIKRYLPMLENKKVGIIANHSSKIGNTHLIDTLVSLGVNVTKIFAPEHGFRGNAGAGEHVSNSIDAKTGIEVVSLYGKNKKPTQQQLENIDIMLFDIQDVGVRFYTYISTMTYAMEACAEKKIPFLVLDRPNPNGHYVDGPVLKPQYKSFVGLHSVPVVYGMTMAEYALMVNNENWLKNGLKCDLHYVLCLGYDHQVLYQLPIAPSPNLPTMSSVYLYPSLCFFEGTPISVGRGTQKPFQQYGHPNLKNGTISFIPQNDSINKHPKLAGKTCNGHDLQSFGMIYIKSYRKLYLFWLLDAYKNYPDNADFFTTFFNTLAGNSEFKQQIINNVSEENIRKSWENDIKNFKKIRKKYLLYKDFE